jgi:hypothetical protein
MSHATIRATWQIGQTRRDKTDERFDAIRRLQHQIVRKRLGLESASHGPSSTKEGR